MGFVDIVSTPPHVVPLDLFPSTLGNLGSGLVQSELPLAEQDPSWCRGIRLHAQLSANPLVHRCACIV